MITIPPLHRSIIPPRLEACSLPAHGARLDCLNLQLHKFEPPNAFLCAGSASAQLHRPTRKPRCPPQTPANQRSYLLQIAENKSSGASPSPVACLTLVDDTLRAFLCLPSFSRRASNQAHITLISSDACAKAALIVLFVTSISLQSHSHRSLHNVSHQNTPLPPATPITAAEHVLSFFTRENRVCKQAHYEKKSPHINHPPPHHITTLLAGKSRTTPAFQACIQYSKPFLPPTPNPCPCPRSPSSYPTYCAFIPEAA
jgi:hypothetical protein